MTEDGSTVPQASSTGRSARRRTQDTGRTGVGRDEVQGRLGAAQAATPGEIRAVPPGAAPEVTLVLDARLFLWAALCCIVMLAAVGLLVAYLSYVRDAGLHRLILRGFLLDEETNLPTLFAFSLLVFCSIMLALISARAYLAREPFRIRWSFLATLFFLIAFDEAAMLHERLNGPTRAALEVSGYLHFAWIIPFGGLVVVLALLYLPLLHSLPAPVGRLFILAGALYVGGAIGMEMPGAAHYVAHGDQNFTYHFLATVEETLEMLGLAVFAYALLRYLARGGGGVRLDFRPGPR